MGSFCILRGLGAFCARGGGVWLVVWCAMNSPAAPVVTGPRGSLGIHDPSTIIKHNGRYYLFGTGRGIVSKSSADGILWTDGPAVFATPPAWVTNAAPGFNGDFWAPDIAFINGKYCLYYSVSSWGSQQSGIGLVTSPTLDPTAPDYLWTDQGVVIQSVVGSSFNTIDPSIAFDANGNPWMAYGSYWSGIYLVQLDPVTGKRITPSSPLTQLAYNSSIEAACLTRRGGYYYLFVNWGSCCDGVDSTYNIRVGRSTSITGPYLDRNGVDLRSSAGTLFLEASGKYAGPGHVGVFNENGQDWFSYHYYDAGDYAPWYGAYGAAKFDLAPLSWSADDWPVFNRDWSAIYNFDADARDEHGQYYGMVQGGTIQTDATRGRVLNLNGTNQLVRLPAGVANARTFAAVVKWNGGAAWQRIFDFGVDTTDYVMLTPSSGNGRLRCDLRVNNVTQTLEWTSGLPVGAWTHVALTLDGARGVLFVNGNPVATNATMNFSPLQVRAQTNHLGRSKFVADADFNGQISSFRVYGRALSAAEIASPVPRIARPSAGEGFSPGTTIAFSGSATDYNDLPLAAARLNWRIEYVQDGQTNLVFGPLNGVTNGIYAVPADATNGIYLISLTATNLAGRTQTDTVRLSRVAPPPEWGSFYPFTSNALDASNRFHGTLQSGASIVSDATRANVVNLGGSSQYVNLAAGAGALNTWSGWVKWNGGNAWQRIFDFGVDTSRWLFLTPKDGSGFMQCAITTDNARYNRVLQTQMVFPVNEWLHLAVMFDGKQGVLYTNGQPAVVHNSVNLLPSDIGVTRAWLGRSQFPADAYFNGRLDSVRLNSRALTLSEITAPTPVITAPTAGARYAGGDTIHYTGRATDYADASLPASAFTWSAEFREDAQGSAVFGPVTGATNGSWVIPTTGPLSTNVAYRLHLSVTDANGNQQTTYTDVLPRLASLDFDTVPSGLQVQFDGQPLNTPTSLVTVVGLTRTLTAPAPQSLGGSNYNFVLWSDGGAASHAISVPTNSATFTASFVPPTIGIAADAAQLVLSWPTWASSLQLYSATNLAPPVVWRAVTNAPGVSNNLQTLSLPLVGEQQFFRLQSP